MEFKILILLLFTIILSLLNHYQKKFKFCLDHATTEEKHKKLLSLNNQTPLSGTIYFFIITSILFYKDESYLLIPCIFFFGIGFFADLKILKSPKLRLILQFLILLIFFSIFHEIKIDLRIDLLNKLMQKNIFNVLIISFFLLVLVNGYNFIDGVNNLSSLNFLIILTFIYLLCESIII